MAQLLLPSDIGIVAMATSISASIDAISQLGVREALVRLTDHDAELYDTGFSVQVARSILTASLMLILSFFSPHLLGDPRMTSVLVVYAGIAFLGAFENIGLVLVTREMDFKSLFILQVVPRIIGFLVTLFLAFALRSYWAIVIGAAVAKAAWVVMSYIVSPHRPKFGRKGLKYLLHFSFWAWLNSIFVTVWNRCEPFLIGPVIGAGPLGIFMLAAELAMLPVTELLDPICAALFPSFALAQREGNSPVHMGLTVGAILMLGTLPFAIALSATSGYLVVGLLGSKWLQTQPLIAIMTWACVFSPFSYVSSTALNVQGEVRRATIASGLATLFKLVVLVSVRHQPLVVIAGFIVLIVGLECIFYIFQLSAAGNRDFRDLAMTAARGLLAGAICCLALYFIPGTWKIVHMSRVAAIAIGGLIGAVVFPGFGAAVFAVWKLFGSPDGAEKRAFLIFQEKWEQFTRVA